MRREEQDPGPQPDGARYDHIAVAIDIDTFAASADERFRSDSEADRLAALVGRFNDGRLDIYTAKAWGGRMPTEVKPTLGGPGLGATISLVLTQRAADLATTWSRVSTGFDGAISGMLAACLEDDADYIVADTLAAAELDPDTYRPLVEAALRRAVGRFVTLSRNPDRCQKWYGTEASGQFWISNPTSAASVGEGV